MAEGLPIFTVPYVPFSLGMGSLFVLSGEPSERKRPALGFPQPKQSVSAAGTECLASAPCGWCPDCVGG